MRCPECGEVFKAPAMDVRTTGLGLSPPYFGRVVCPKCNQAKRRGKFLKVSRPEGSGAS